MAVEADSLTLGAGTPFPVRVNGLRRAQSALRKAGADLADMPDVMHDIGEVVVQSAHVPTRSGKLAGSLRAGRGRTKAVVRMGSKRVPYAGVIEWGKGDSYSAAGRYLNPARDRSRGRILSTFEAGLARILAKNDLS